MRVLAVTNMYPSSAHPAQGTFVEQQIVGLRRIGVDVDVLFINRKAQGTRAYLALPALLRSRLAEYDADIVHIMYGGIMADLATRVVTHKPTVVTFHGSDLLGEHLNGLARKLIARYGVFASNRAARRATGIVVVADALKRRLPSSVDPAKVRTIPCGIDLDRFRSLDAAECRRELQWSDDGFHVLFNSNGGDPVKQQDLARSAVAVLKETGVPAEFHEMFGQPYDQVPRWLNASHVLLLTSRHEGSPTIVKEALACNRPVVSVDVGDVRQRIEGIEGCHIALATPEALAAKLQMVHKRSGDVDGRSTLEPLSVERIAMTLSDFYKELLGRRS